jgi:leucyl-tRNA synthetase
MPLTLMLMLSRPRHSSFPAFSVLRQEAVGISESELPLVLPPTDDFAPSGTPDPPLAKCKEWVAAKDPLTGTAAGQHWAHVHGLF